MSIKESLRSLRREELGEFARQLYENKSEFGRVVAELTKSDDPGDYAILAELLSYAPVDGTGSDDIYAPLETVGKGYLDLFLRAVRAERIPESEYIKVMLAAQYAKSGSAFSEWDGAVDRYIEQRAAKDFDGIAELIDKYDVSYGKYGALIRVDRRRAVMRLLNLALFTKNIDKTAVRDVLMDHPELSDELFGLYSEANAKDRAAIVRLLLLYKNEPSVSDFLESVVAADKSKTVRDLVSGAKKSAGKNAAAYFERLMTTGEPVIFGELKSLVADGKKSVKNDKSKKAGKSYAEVADRILFYYVGGDFADNCIFTFNNGKFLDVDGNKLSIPDEKNVYVLHPLDIPSNLKSVLKGGIEQPFLQLARPVFEPLAGETYFSERLNGIFVTRARFDRALSALKFRFSQNRDGSDNDIAVCVIGEYAAAVKCGFNGADGSVACDGITFYNSRDIVKLKRTLYVSSARTVSVREIPPKIYSELMYSCYRLFDSADIK